MQRLVIAVAAASMFPAGAGLAAESAALTRADLAAWLDGYEEAWETLDADRAAALFTEDATYQDSPYSEPHQGRNGIHDYWSTVTSDQQDVDFSYEVLSVSGNTGIAHWHSELTQKSSGSQVVLDGIFVLEFSPDGLCRTLREWWHVKVEPQ